jgi:hypothetical protein
VLARLLENAPPYQIDDRRVDGLRPHPLDRDRDADKRTRTVK